jgi:hypothetical protein
MPDTSNQKYPEPFEVISWGQTVKYLNIAVIARCSTEMKYPERFAETITFKAHF